ncbi:MAG: RnfABCDGE type electron transport complex subunit B [Sedimentisphaerales bacterium]|nr:RnfABCDGE type electron transport complex subunit B [Sedimentisphaerales bacterium]
MSEILLANVTELWNTAWPAGLIMLGLAAVFAIVLLIASIKLKVEVDPKVEQVHKALPGIDCGACGYAGCASYAKAVVENPELIGKCAPGGAKVAAQIGAILNLQISESGPPKRPIVHCRAHKDDKTCYADYQGIETCTAANALANVQACKFGCLGFGDCVAACKFDALHIIDGLATVDYQKCTGCGACAKACPRDLIKMVPFTNENMLVVACSSKEAGKDTRKMCAVGCIACGLCAKQTELFTVSNNLAGMDYEKYQPDDKTEIAYNKCPTCVIVYRGKNAPAPRQPKKKAEEKV